MNKGNRRLVFSLIAFGMVLVLGVVILVLARSSDSSSSSNRVSSQRSSGFVKAKYLEAYSEQEYLKKKVSSYENYLVRWVSSYVGRAGDGSQNTSSLAVDGAFDEGHFTSLDALFLKYPQLNGVVSNVFISYYYDADNQELVQALTVERSSIGDTKTVYVTYDKSAKIVNYLVTIDSL